MALVTLTVRVAPEELDYLDQLASQHEGILSKQGVVRLLLQYAAASQWDPLDKPVTLGLPSAAGSPSKAVTSTEEELTTTSSKKTKTRVRCPYSAKALDPGLVPGDLLDCQQLLLEFWAGKKGGRTESIWNRVCNRLRGWTPDQRREALERASNAGWGDVYEPTPAPAQRQQPARQSLTEQARALGMI
jgi:hypothetical protein